MSRPRFPDSISSRRLPTRAPPQVDALISGANDSAQALGVRSTPSFAAGKTGGELELLSVTSLTADALRPALDSLLAE